MQAAVVTIAFFFLLRETYASTILQKKTNRLRKDTGNPDLRSKLDSGLTALQTFKTSIIRPLKMLCLSPIVMILSLMMAFTYGILYLLFTTITEVFEGDYGFSGGIVGLTYLGIGIGLFLGLGFFGTMSDRGLKKKKEAGLEMKPEHRLPLLIPGVFCVPIGLFIYGWTVKFHIFWFVPIFGTAFVGIGLIATFVSSFLPLAESLCKLTHISQMPIQSYLVDAFTRYASSAIAACTILRSILGALLPLAGPSMYAALGYGWGNSLLGFIALAMVPVPFLLMKYGEAIRTNPRFQVKL
jgi:MFS family permease